MAFVQGSASVPVNGCYMVKCGTCGKSTWKVSLETRLLPREVPHQLLHRDSILL